MANQPQFAAGPVVGSSVLSATADSSYTAPAHAVTIATAVAFTVASVTTVSGSILATATAFPNVANGMSVTGTGIAAGTTVVANVGGTLVLSIAATASSTVTLTFGTNGVKIEEVDFVGTGTTLAGVVQLYLYDGTTYHAHFSQLVTAITPSTTVIPFFQAVTFTNLEIPAGWSLVATSFVASQLINVIAFGGAL